jgi:cytochrome c553
MKRVLRWFGLSLGGFIGLVVVSYTAAYVLSEIKLRHTHEIPKVELSIPTDQASIIEGQRLAIIHGCFAGCHGQQAGGAVMFEQPLVARIVAPNLTAAVHSYSDAQLAVAIRHGLRPDGRSMIIMPSDAFIVLNDDDLGRIVAFLKNLPPVAGWEPSVSLGPLGRIGLAVGKFRLVTQLIKDTVPPPEASEEQAAFGRYLARSTCAQCHGTSLRGDSNPDFTSPDLHMVGAYTPEQFTALMRTGTALGGRELGVMSDWARQHLAYFTDAEIAAMYDYLSHFR